MRPKPSLLLIIVLSSVLLVFSVFAILTAIVSPKHLFLLLGGLTAFCITMLRPEYGLILLVFTLPWTLQIKVETIAEAPFKIGSDDVILFGMTLGWLTHMATEKAGPFLPSPLNLPIIAFITCASLSLIPLGLTKGMGVLTICGLHLLKWIQVAFIYFVVHKVVNTEEQVKRFVILSLITCAIIAVAQLVLTATGHYGMISMRPEEIAKMAVPEEEARSAITAMRRGGEIYLGTGEIARVAIPGVESNGILGAYYLLFFGIVLAMLTSTGIRHKGPLIAFTVILSLGILFTYGRANYLGLAVVLLVLTITGGGAKVRLPFIFLMLSLFALIYFLPTVIERVAMTVQLGRVQVKFEQSANERLINWRKAVDVFIERPTNPVIGIGFWGARFHGAWGFSTVHNQYLAYLIEMGIIGFAIFCWLMKRVIHQTLLLYKRSPPEDYFSKALSIGFLAGLIGVLASSFFGETLESTRILGPFWFTIALIVALKEIKEKEKESELREEVMLEAYPEVQKKVTSRSKRFVDKYFS